jgi:hypothetical protein
MDLSGALPALRRRAFVAAGLAALVCAASSVRAQDPAPAAQAAAPAQEDGLKFNHDGDVLLIWSIKPDRAEGFETAWRTIKAALAANASADIQAFGRSIEINKVATPPGGPSVVFVFRLSPASKTLSYNHVKLLFETLKAPTPDPAAPAGAQPPPGTFTYDQAKELFDKIDNSWTEQGVVPWPLTKIG